MSSSKSTEPAKLRSRLEKWLPPYKGPTILEWEGDQYCNQCRSRLVQFVKEDEDRGYCWDCYYEEKERDG